METREHGTKNEHKVYMRIVEPDLGCSGYSPIGKGRRFQVKEELVPEKISDPPNISTGDKAPSEKIEEAKPILIKPPPIQEKAFDGIMKIQEDMKINSESKSAVETPPVPGFKPIEDVKSFLGHCINLLELGADRIITGKLISSYFQEEYDEWLNKK